MLKRRMTSLGMTIILFLSLLLNVYAAPGENGFFGGVTEGIMLPKTISHEVGIEEQDEYILSYKEVIFITGEPIEVTGSLTINKKDDIIDQKDSGSYKETYEITAMNLDNSVQLEREVTLETYFVKYDSPNGKQIKKDSTVVEWDETIIANGVEYVVDENLSDFNKGKNFTSFIEDHTPGIIYYSGNMSNRIVYKVNDAIYAEVLIEGESYGYDQPWSKVENQTYIVNIDKKGSDGWQMLIEINPFINSKKTQSYNKNNVPAISFTGTYTQIFDTIGGMTYEIKTNHPELAKEKLSGNVYQDTTNDFEKLKIPGQLTYVSKSHFAYNDIMKLMSMNIINESPLKYQPYEAISRGEFTLMLLKGMNITPPEVKKTKMDDYMVFSDVPPEHDLYLWLYTAKDSKLVKGRENNYFKADEPLTREEAFTLLMRVIGLEHISIDSSTITPYVDDADISSWAKDAIYAGTVLGLFKGSTDGKMNPKAYVSKSEAAAIVNRLIDFLRTDMVNYYKIY